MKAVVFLPNWLGDFVMATPVLRALRRKFGNDARLVGILRPYLSEVFAGTRGSMSNGFSIPGLQDRSRHSWAVANRMRKEGFDLAVLLTNSLRPALMAWLGQGGQRIGYVRNGRGPFVQSKTLSTAG